MDRQTHHDWRSVPQTTARSGRHAASCTYRGAPRQWQGVGSLPAQRHDGLLAFCALAHELKQPLAAILSNAQAGWRFLAMGTPDLTEVGAALHDIIADTRRTVEVIQRLQAFVTTGALERTRLDINAVIREVIQLVHSDATRQHLTLSLDLAADLPMVLGDRIQLRQVLLNLVRNAFEAMQTQDDATRTLAMRSTCETRDVVTIAVQDSGMGLDEASMARLFHLFFTTKAGGMGLGLALSNPFADVAPPLRTNTVDVLYATDRRPQPRDDGTLAYGYGRSPSLAVGSWVVEIGENISWDTLVEQSQQAEAAPP